MKVLAKVIEAIPTTSSSSPVALCFSQQSGDDKLQSLLSVGGEADEALSLRLL